MNDNTQILAPPQKMDSSSSESSSSDEQSPGIVKTLDDVTNEENYCAALGILPVREGPPANGDYWDDGDEDEIASKTGDKGVSNFYNLVPNPDADEVDLSVLRGATSITGKERMKDVNEKEGSDDLNALSELVPNLVDPSTHRVSQTTLNATFTGQHEEELEKQLEGKKAVAQSPAELIDENPIKHMESNVATKGDNVKNNSKEFDEISRDSSVTALKDADVESNNGNGQGKVSKSNEQDISGFEVDISDSKKTPKATSRQEQRPRGKRDRRDKRDKSRYNSGKSVSSATLSTHEVRMPMFLPTFKPATGCTNASDFIVRCFVARLRSGITVVKHGRSRWCKSRLRILHVHQDGRSLSWKPALGEPTSSKRPPKLDLSTCSEVRHAWSPDPLYPMFTGTLILRNKCEAANAHKSFALIFPKRTVDITGLTADQCKVLMEGFSALCFRLQVAELAGQGGKKKGESGNESDGVETTASNTLTNNSGIGNSPLNSSKSKNSRKVV